MALYGTITGTTSNEHISARIEWTATQNVDKNQSIITARGILSRTNAGFKTYGTGTFYLTIDGVRSPAQTGYVEITQDSNTQVIIYTKVVDHESDGSKSVSISFTGSIQGTTLSSITCSQVVTLDVLPIGPDFTFPTEISVGKTPFYGTVLIPYYEGGTNSLEIFVNGKEISVSKQSNYEFSYGIFSDVFNDVPDRTELDGFARLTTKTGNNVVFERSKQFVVSLRSIPPDVDISFEYLNTLNGRLVQNVSSAKPSFDITLYAGAKIYTKTVSIQGIKSITYYANEEPTPILLTTFGEGISFTGSVTDTRGNTGVPMGFELNQVFSYNAPSVTAEISRCTSSGLTDKNGTYAAITPNIIYSDIDGQNSVKIVYKYREKGSNAWSSPADLSNSKKVVIGGNLSGAKCYEIMISATDNVGKTSERIFEIPQAIFVGVFAPDRFGFLKYPEGKGGWIGGDLTISGNLNVNGNINEQKFPMPQNDVLKFIDGTSINDLNDCINRGIYMFVNGGTVPQHCPFNSRTFFLIVLENGSGELGQPVIIQIGIMYDVHGAQIQKRSSYFGEFGMWE